MWSRDGEVWRTREGNRCARAWRVAGAPALGTESSSLQGRKKLARGVGGSQLPKHLGFA